MVIDRGNHSHRGDPEGPRPSPIVLAEKTWVTGGLFLWARFENVRDLYRNGELVPPTWVRGDHDLHIDGGNTRGAWVNRVELDSFESPVRVPLPLAVGILEWIVGIGGTDARVAWVWTCGWLIANPAASYDDWQAAYIVWAESTTNTFYSAAAFTRLRDRWFPGKSFGEVGDAVTAETLATWRGENTKPPGEGV